MRAARACALLLPVAVQANSFEDLGQVSAAEALQDLQIEESNHGSQEVLHNYTETLAPMYDATEKNQHGKVSHTDAIYLLHRMFVARHSWYIQGLENFNPKSAEKESLPSFLLQATEKHSQQGLALHDLAALAATVEDLADKEAQTRIHKILTSLDWLKRKTLKRYEAEDVLTIYLIVYLNGGVFSFKTKREIIRKVNWFAASYSGWNGAVQWLADLEEQEMKPLKELAVKTDQEYTFDEVKRVAVLVGSRFGRFNDQECSGLKEILLKDVPRSRKAGRIRLPDFYNQGLKSRWNLTETQEFLEHLGALDKTNASNPLVIVPNYLTSKPQCMPTSDFYASCCRNECEDFLGSLEQSIAAPAARPAKILELVSALRAQTSDASQEMSTSLMAKLEHMAATGDGTVHLHSRLFAEWMHLAFPNECPFPQDMRAKSEWSGEESHSETELRRVVAEDVCDGAVADADEFFDLPWSWTLDDAQLSVPVPSFWLSLLRGKVTKVCIVGVLLFSTALLLALRFSADFVPSRTWNKTLRLYVSARVLLGLMAASVLWLGGLIDDIAILFVMPLAGLAFVSHVQKANKQAKFEEAKLSYEV